MKQRQNGLTDVLRPPVESATHSNGMDSSLPTGIDVPDWKHLIKQSQ